MTLDAPDDLEVEPSGCVPWPVVWPCDTTNVDPLLLGAAASLAEQLLWSLSGYRVGVCTFREAFRQPNTGYCGVPYKDANGNWRNNGQTGGQCCRILLTHRPVESIVAVRRGSDSR